MSTLTFPTIGVGKNADTSATPTTMTLRDASGGGLYTTVTAASVVSTGSLVRSNRTVTGTYSATTSDDLIFADATGGAFTVTLPAVATVSGHVIAVKRINSGSNQVTIGVTDGSIDGVATKVSAAQWDVFRFYCNGSVWFLV